MPTGGGRVNEIAARPICLTAVPNLAHIRQPVAVESAVRRSALSQIALEVNYGVEIALLIDVARQFGLPSVAQVDLGVLNRRNKPIDELQTVARDVIRTAISRFGIQLPRQSEEATFNSD